MRPSRRTTARVSHPSRLVEPVIGPAGGRTRWLAPPAITAKPLRGDDDGECGAIEFIRRNSAISPRIAPEFCWEFLTLRSEGAGNAGRPMRPQPRVECR